GRKISFRKAEREQFVVTTKSIGGHAIGAALLTTTLALSGIALSEAQTGTVPPDALNVLSYGAKGDGRTNDRTAIQKAVDAAKAGDTVYFPAGTYLMAGGVRVDKGNITLLG